MKRLNFRKLRDLLLPEGDHAAANQKTPLNTNRYVLLFIYIVYTFLSSNPYFGWRSLSFILTQSGAYSWLCTEAESSSISQHNGSITCDEQDKHIQQLFTIAMSCHFTMSAFGGLLIDVLGPKFTALLGQLLNITGWLMLSFCGANFRYYSFAFVFIGAGCDVGFLPTLVLSNIFPGNSAFCIAILGSAVSANFAITLIMEKIWRLSNYSMSIQTIFISYLIIGPLFSALLAMIFIPRKSFFGSDVVFSPNQVSPILSLEQIPQKCEQSDNSTQDIEMKSNTDDRNDRSFDTREARSFQINNRNNQREIKVIYPCSRIFGKYLNLDLFKSSEMKSIFKIAFSGLYLSICAYFMVCSIVLAYYSVSAGRNFHYSVEQTLSVILPFSFIPCLIIGKIIDIYGVTYVIFGLNTIGVLMYLLACFDVLFLQYISIVLNTAYVSVYTSQLYCFVNDTFPSKHFGKLLGVASACGGLISLTAQALYSRLTIEVMKGKTLVANLVVIFMLSILFPIILYMHNEKKKRNLYYTRCLKTVS